MSRPAFTCPKCSRRRNSRGRPFKSQQAVLDHARTCPSDASEDPTSGRIYPEGCPVEEDDTDSDVEFPLTSLYGDDDMPDGAWLALAWELGEW